MRGPQIQSLEHSSTLILADRMSGNERRSAFPTSGSPEAEKRARSIPHAVEKTHVSACEGLGEGALLDGDGDGGGVRLGGAVRVLVGEGVGAREAFLGRVGHGAVGIEG